MQARDDQDAVQDAVDKQPDLARAEHCAAQAVHALLERRPAPAERTGEHEPGKARDDRDEAPPAEEREIARQAYLGVAVVEEPRDAARDQSRGHRELRHGAGRDAGQHLGAARRDEIAHDRGEARRAMVLAGDADRDADCEQDPEIGEDRLARGGDGRQVEEIGLSEAQQEAGNRQDCDRQHQSAPELLQAGEPALHGVGSASASAMSARTAAASCAASARSARARHSISVRRRNASLIAGMAAGTADSSPTPSPTSSGAATGSDASPPQTATARPAVRAAAQTDWMAARIAGCSASSWPASVGCVRSIASMYCVRSLVPIEKKSACAARRAAPTAAAGVSIMIPTGMSALPRARGASSRTIARTASIS